MAVLHLLSKDCLVDYVLINGSWTSVGATDMITFIRKQKRLANVKIVIVSEYVSEDDLRRFRGIGADHCMEMKFETVDIIRVLETLSKNN